MKIVFKTLTGVALAALAMSALPAQAQGTERGQAERPLSQRLLACRDIESAVERLDCFDRVARMVSDDAEGERGSRGRGLGRERAEEARESAQSRAEANRERADVRQEEALQRAAEAREAADERRQQDRSDDFGREHRRDRDRDAEDDRRYIEITEAWQNPRGLWRFRLADGSEWHQTQSGRFQYDEEEVYYIERGMMNSFRLGWDGSNRNVRVRRVD